MDKKDTSWNEVADWYDKYLNEEPDSYQKQVVLPNLLRLLDIKKGETVLDLACGTGYFSREFDAQGAKVSGADLSPKLIQIAKEHSPKTIEYYKSSADDLKIFPDENFDKIVIVLAIQNIAEVKKMLAECNRVLKKDGTMFIVMNHPVFRVPKGSSWGWDEENKKQYRRIDKYLSESKEEIEMHPGLEPGVKTFTFHRSLQYYFKLFNNTGFAVSRMEEWISHKKSLEGSRQSEEDRTRREIPLFLMLELIKNKYEENKI